MRKFLMLTVMAGAAAVGLGAAAPAEAAPHGLLTTLSAQPEAQVQQVQYRRGYHRRPVYHRRYRRHGRY
jgi:hypothetical protein